MRCFALTVCALGLAAAGCGSPAAPASASPKTEPSAPTELRAADPEPADRVAYFAGGCFWGVEHYLEQMEGVTSVESGYMGGHLDEPSYEDVSSQTSGHYETVRVRFDPDKIPYEAIAKRFFEIHDPTQKDGQGPDIGPEYRSVVFYTSDAQKETTKALIAKLVDRGYDVVTEVRPAEQFWEAEGYHQNYYARSGKTPYCHVRVRRFGD